MGGKGGDNKSPSAPQIVMDLQVAEKRGLSLLSSSTSSQFHVWGDVERGRFVLKPEPTLRDVSVNYSSHHFVLRRARIRDEEQQIAEVSISHEAEYAVAVCMALDEKTLGKANVEYLYDNGTGEPLHEPIWGDAGWLEEQDRDKPFR
ncbi:MAG: hypothetical protein Q9218_002045 [Villophora microphyllina]